MRTQLEKRISNSSSKKILNVCHVLSSWHRDQWRKDLVVICMKTGNLGIYLNFKNLSKTWHVNTNREQIHNGLFLSIHFHLLSNVMCFLWKNWNMRKSPGWAEDNFILNLRRKQFMRWQRHGWRNKFNLSPLLGFSLKSLGFPQSMTMNNWRWVGNFSNFSPDNWAISGPRQ